MSNGEINFSKIGNTKISKYSAMQDFLHKQAYHIRLLKQFYKHIFYNKLGALAVCLSISMSKLTVNIFHSSSKNDDRI